MSIPLDFGSSKSIELRPYQSKIIADTWDWLRNNDGNVCIESPGGTGKSIIIAELCKQALQGWPKTKILMLVAQKELIEQNRDELRGIWKNAPLGIYSASIGRREIDAITFAGIASIHKRAEMLGHVDLILVDECDLINHHDEGMYRNLIRDLTNINPALRVIGLTATPFRLGFGKITDQPAIFKEILVAITIEEAVNLGYLAPLRSKDTKAKLSVNGVHVRGGDYIPKELQAAVDIDEKTLAIASEIIEKAEWRLHWLVFCAGVDHALHVRDAIRAHGITCETVTGETPKIEREKIIADYKAGKIKCLTNAFVLTRGFNFPDIDLIALLCPTKSPNRYIQEAVRGSRLKSHTDHCRVLDFAGVVESLGPITNVMTPRKAGEGDGIPPSKSCSECGEIVATAVRICPACGHPFPEPKKEELALRNDDIMGREPSEMEVDQWSWSVQRSRKTDLPMIVVTYYGKIGSSPIKEFLCLWHEGFAQAKAQARLRELAKGCHVPWEELQGDDATQRMERAYPPRLVKYKMEGKYPRIVGQEWALSESEGNEIDEEDVPF